MVTKTYLFFLTDTNQQDGLMALAKQAGYSDGVPRDSRGEGPPFAPQG